MLTFKELLKAAQQVDATAAGALYEQYQPLIQKLSWHDGVYDMDLYQTLSMSFLDVLSKFKIN